MRRTILIGTAAAMLVFAGVAYAASLNNYTAKLSFSGKAGTAKAPAPIGWTEDLSASSADPSENAAPLIDIKTTIYGMKVDSKDFPTCSNKTIDAPPKFNAACPKNSEIASGSVKAILGPTNRDKSKGVPCNPDLAVYNAGGGKAWYFFTTKNATQCDGLPTGATAPYEGSSKMKGKNLVLDVPLPPAVSTDVANANLYGSLVFEQLKWAKLTTKKHGKTVAYMSSVGCKAGKRPWSVAFTATDSSGAKETKTVSGKAKC